MCAFYTHGEERNETRSARDCMGRGRNIDRVKEIRSCEEKAVAVVSMNEFDD